MTRTIVGILRGGTSSEYDLSLKTGAAMMAALPEDGYDVRDILVDRSGVWHARGIPADPARALAQVDVVLNALHGGVGEDGSVARILERAGVPYAGSRPHASALALHKGRAREALRAAGIRMPEGFVFTLGDELDTAQMAGEVFRRFGPPYVIKPPTEGSSYGIRIADTVIELPDMIADCLDAYGAALVEQYVHGHDATVGLIEGFRGEDLYALPPAHLVVADGSRIIHSGHHRNDGAIEHRMPSAFSHEDKLALIEAARTAHRALELEHFSHADFVLTPRGPYLLEVNTTPGFYPNASFPRMLEGVGSSTREFLEHSIALARSRPRV